MFAELMFRTEWLYVKIRNKIIVVEVNIMCEQSHTVGNERELEECNCSVLCEQRLYDVSADRSVSGTTIIATNYR